VLTASTRRRSLLEATAQGATGMAAVVAPGSPPSMDHSSWSSALPGQVGRTDHAACTLRRRSTARTAPAQLAPDARQQPLAAPRSPSGYLRGAEGTSNALLGLVDDPVGVPLFAIARPAAPARRARNDLYLWQSLFRFQHRSDPGLLALHPDHQPWPCLLLEPSRSVPHGPSGSA